MCELKVTGNPPGWEKNIKLFKPLFQGRHAMFDVARNPIHVPLAHEFLLRSDIKDSPPLQHHPHLLMGVLVLRDG